MYKLDATIAYTTMVNVMLIDLVYITSADSPDGWMSTQK
jgi:hypothetical protein